jgi:hypothetical protein
MITLKKKAMIWAKSGLTELLDDDEFMELQRAGGAARRYHEESSMNNFWDMSFHYYSAEAR